MQLKLDQAEHPGTSRLDLEWARERSKKASRKRKGARLSLDDSKENRRVTEKADDAGRPSGVLSNDWEDQEEEIGVADQEKSDEFEEDDFDDDSWEPAEDDASGHDEEATDPPSRRIQ